MNYLSGSNIRIECLQVLSLHKSFTVLLPVEVLDFGARVLEGGHPSLGPALSWRDLGQEGTCGLWPHRRTNSNTTHEEAQKEFAKRDKNGDEKLTLC